MRRTTLGGRGAGQVMGICFWRSRDDQAVTHRSGRRPPHHLRPNPARPPQAPSPRRRPWIGMEYPTLRTGVSRAKGGTGRTGGPVSSRSDCHSGRERSPPDCRGGRNSTPPRPEAVLPGGRAGPEGFGGRGGVGLGGDGLGGQSIDCADGTPLDQIHSKAL